MHSLTWVPHLDQVCLNAFCSICRFICFIQSLFVSQPSRYERSGQCNRFCWNTKLSWKSQLNLWISEISTGHICWYLRTYLPCTTYFDTYFMFDSYTEIYIYMLVCWPSLCCQFLMLTITSEETVMILER